MVKIGNLHQHIDNGGISVDVEFNPDNGHTCISFNTSYFGYPDVTATLCTQGVAEGGDAKFLEQLGLMFIRASAEVRPLIEAWMRREEGQFKERFGEEK